MEPTIQEKLTHKSVYNDNWIFDPAVGVLTNAITHACMPARICVKCGQLMTACETCGQFAQGPDGCFFCNNEVYNRCLVAEADAILKDMHMRHHNKRMAKSKPRYGTKKRRSMRNNPGARNRSTR
jgi:hypothetical protein